MKRIMFLSLSVALLALALWAPAATVQSADTARVVFYVG
jgi:hypothetical protein